MHDNDLPCDTLTVPVTACFVCGAAETRPGDACSRCGATAADVRALLRAGANAYHAARDAALLARFAEARGHLRVAASLGLANAPAWRELFAAVNAADPPVSAKDAHDYALAYHLASRGRFTDTETIVLPNTPVARELKHLCRNAATQTRQAVWASGTRYVLFAAVCFAVAALTGC